MVARRADGIGYVSATPRQRVISAALALGAYLLLIALLSWRSPPPVRYVDDPLKTVALLPVAPPPPPPFEPVPKPKPKASIEKATPDDAPPLRPRSAPAHDVPLAAPSPMLPAPQRFDITPVRSAPPVVAVTGASDRGQGDGGAAGAGNSTGAGGGEGSGGNGGGDAGSTIVRANWVKLLSWTDIHRFHPASALARGVSGRAVITCQVHRSKHAYNCNVRSETPPGERFGAAAVAMAPLYRIEPRRVDGKAIDDGRVIFTVNFFATIAEARKAGVPTG